MKCDDCGERLRVRQSYSGENWRVQRMVCPGCANVYRAETTLILAKGYGMGAFARAKELKEERCEQHSKSS